MNFNHIPFYISWEMYIEFINSNFSELIISTDALFITYIILQFLYIYLILQLCKFIYTVCIYLKNYVFSRRH